MKRIIFARAIFALLLLCSMGWGATTYKLTVTAGANGTAKSSATTVTAGKTATITATPNTGYVFTYWTVSSKVSCVLPSNKDNPATVTVNSDCTIKANFRQVHTLKVTATAGGTAVIIANSEEVTTKVGYHGTAWKIKATVNSGYRFDGWTVFSGSSEKCIIADPSALATIDTLREDCTLRANFVKQYTLKVASANTSAGTVSPSGSQTVDTGTKTSIKATAKSGYRFDKWTTTAANSCPVASATSASTTVTVKAACTVTASFVQQFALTVATADAIQGTVSPSGTQTVDTGSKTSIKATAKSGYRFGKWTTTDASNCPIASATSASTTVTVKAKCTVTASFVQTFTLTRVAGTGGLVSNAGDKIVDTGTKTAIEATVKSGYRFDKWTTTDATNCPIASATSASTTVTVKTTCTVSANFIQQFVLTVATADANQGTVFPSGTQTVDTESKISITATPKDGYHFDKWITTDVTNCPIASTSSASTTVTVKAKCTVTAKFVRTGRLVVNASEHTNLQPKDVIVDVGTIVGLGLITSDDYQFSHFEYKSGGNNCLLIRDYNKFSVYVNGDCELEPVIVPYFELTENFKTYYHYTNGTNGARFVRFHAATEDSTWYYVEYVSPGDQMGIIQNYGEDMWTGDPLSSCSGNTDTLRCYFKSVEKDNYLVASSSLYTAHSFDIKYVKVETALVDVEYDVFGKIIDKGTLELGVGMDTLIKAEDLTGYALKEWKLMDGDCSIDDVTKAEIRLITNASRCRVRAVYGEKDNANVGISFRRTSWSNSVMCGFVSLADSNASYIKNWDCSGSPSRVAYFDSSDFELTYNGEPIKTYGSGDTIKLAYANKSMFSDSISTLVPSKNQECGIYTCIVTPTGFFNGDSFELAVSTTYAGKALERKYTIVEPPYHELDAPDTIKVFAARDSSVSILRTTDSVRIDVWTQNFFDDEWGFDMYIIDMPKSYFELFGYRETDSTGRFGIYRFTSNRLSVTARCLNSGDEEAVTMTQVENGLYRSSNIAKSEGVATPGDGILTCSLDDRIVVEYDDPIYRTLTYDTVSLRDVVSPEYEFLEKDFSKDLDSVETTEVDFAFRLNAVSSTLDKADTILVALFTDEGDTVWVSAVETDVYSSEFKGRGSFKFVTSEKELKDDQLDAAMDLDSDTNRIVIRLQVGEDNSSLDNRDSLVVFYEFIPADSAEIQDRDYDGRADYVRVHFAKSISEELLKVDSLFWGNEDGVDRSVPFENLNVSKDGRWIDFTLDEPFEYGVTSVGSKDRGYLRISRNTSSISQKLPLADRVGAVPVSAVKRPGRFSEDDNLGGSVELPPDTLVVTLSEPVDTMDVLRCRSQKKSGSRVCAPADMFSYSSDSGRAQSQWLKYESYFTNKAGDVWTFVLPRSENVRVGGFIVANPDAFVVDAAGNTLGEGGVTVTGEDNDLYLYALRAHPDVVGSGAAPTWIDPESGSWEEMPEDVASVWVETRLAYNAYVTVFDNIGHVVTQFRQSFGKKGEKENSAYWHAENSTYVSFLRWNMRTDEDRDVATGVYIWKVHFVFEDGHKEWRTIRSGIKRK